MAEYHLTQLNIAQQRYPMDNPEMGSFVAELDHINALADSAPGFVWRLASEDGDATSITIFGDDMLLVNMSVWEDAESLKAYVYRSDHVRIFRRRAEWFDTMETPHLVMWWIPVGHVPTIKEAERRLERLTAEGSGPEAFGFASLQPQPGLTATR